MVNLKKSVESMNSLQRAEIAIFSAKHVLPLFEIAYPGNNKPRKAIEAAVLLLNNSTKENRDIAAQAAMQAMYAHIAAHHDDIAHEFMNSTISSAHAAAHVAYEAVEAAVDDYDDKSKISIAAFSAIDYAIKTAPTLEGKEQIQTIIAKESDILLANDS